MRHWVLAALAVAGLLAPAGIALAKEKQQVTVSYVLGPARPLPQGLKAVAVIDAGVETQGNKEAEREKKWSTMAADMIESMLATNGSKIDGGLKVAQRRLTKQILTEQDMKLAGLVEGEAATRAGKLLDVQGLITSRITISIDVQKGTKSTVDWGGVLGGFAQGMMNGRHHERRAPVYAPAPAPQPYAVAPRRAAPRHYVYDRRTGRLYAAAPAPVQVVPAPAPAPVAPAGPIPQFATKEVEEVSRHLTVQCSFSLVDAVTGAALMQYSPPPYHKQDNSSPNFLFGGSAELDPVDHFIGELVERATQEFVSMLVPTEVEYSYTVIGKGSAGEAGVRALRADDYQAALQSFLAGYQKDPDYDETVFALGVTSELLGDAQKALNYYRQAAAMKGVDKQDLQTYVAAKKRLTDHIGRIMKASATAPESTPTPAAAAPAAQPAPMPAAGPAAASPAAPQTGGLSDYQPPIPGDSPKSGKAQQ